MQKVILAQILQFMLQIVCSFTWDDDIFQSTRLGRVDEESFSGNSVFEKYSDISSETYSTSSSDEDKSRRRHPKKCKCSCDKCIKPRKCCIEMCSSCIVTQPSIMFPVPYPIPFIVPPPATTTEKPEEKTSTKPTKKDTKKTTTETTTTDTPETKPPETETTEPSMSTSPPTILINRPSSPNSHCPGYSCIPKSWFRGPKFHVGPRRNLGAEKQEIQETPPARQILEVLPEFAERFLSQVHKLKEIPEDERSIDVQVIDVTPYSSQTERNTYSEDFFRKKTQISIEEHRRNFGEPKSNPAPSISALESSSLMNSLENLLPKNNKYYHKKRYIMKARKSRAYQPNNYRRNAENGNIMNRRQYEEVRTFATFPIQKTQKATESETNNKVNIYVVNVNRKPSQKL